jgi:hypothetical protein
MAQISFKTLAKVVAGNTAGVVYSPGAGKQAIVKHMSFTNQTVTDRTLTLFRNGGTAADVFLPAFNVPANSVIEWEGVLTLDTTDNIEAQAAAAAAILVVVDGAEITL